VIIGRALSHACVFTMNDSAAPDLERLMAGYQNGDESAASELIQQVSQLLHRFFMAQVLSRRYADDLLQETWLRIHQARHTHRPGEPVLPWLYAIARHVRVDGYRKAHRVESREKQVEVMPDAARSAGSLPLDRGPDLEALLKELPESQREVITMLKVTGMTLEEVARATSSSIGSVKQKAHRGYQKLGEMLSALGFGHDGQ
jgi:RNA polymerase sigma-70 factor (ECF subfamily)